MLATVSKLELGFPFKLSYLPKEILEVWSTNFPARNANRGAYMPVHVSDIVPVKQLALTFSQNAYFLH